MSDKDRSSSHGLGDELRAMLSDQGKQIDGVAGPSRMREGMESSFAASSSRPRAFRAADSTSAQATDADFGAFQRGSHMDSDMMERAWNQSVLTAPVAAAAPTVPDTQKDAEQFLAALASEENAASASEAPLGSAPIVTIENEWRPPSPSQGLAMSHEQYAMHERLARQQAGLDPEQPYRLAERVEPPADDATLEEGVYARDPTAALETVWDAQDKRSARVQHVQATHAGSIPTSRYTKVRGQEIVDRLRGWLVRQGYTDEVYGLPPMTAQTFGEAVMEAPDAQTEERRATAIRRLDALYRHLSVSRPSGGASDMEAWLQAHPK
ncbi:hypothetical protein MCAP1_003207 [Malassezia caprae]|uniref:Uncharacterized protein n=1 Tax=Malassezia caprae TaxID=1381934 RepID=A0AAF0E736_9BASI|nr:hypothetical protein MCAP1_003207 [Malassezia caprae]